MNKEVLLIVTEQQCGAPFGNSVATFWTDGTFQCHHWKEDDISHWQIVNNVLMIRHYDKKEFALCQEEVDLHLRDLLLVELEIRRLFESGT